MTETVGPWKDGLVGNVAKEWGNHLELPKFRNWSGFYKSVNDVSHRPAEFAEMLHGWDRGVVSKAIITATTVPEVVCWRSPHTQYTNQYFVLNSLNEESCFGGGYKIGVTDVEHHDNLADRHGAGVLMEGIMVAPVAARIRQLYFAPEGAKGGLSNIDNYNDWFFKNFFNDPRWQTLRANLKKWTLTTIEPERHSGNLNQLRGSVVDGVSQCIVRIRQINNLYFKAVADHGYRGEVQELENFARWIKIIGQLNIISGANFLWQLLINADVSATERRNYGNSTRETEELRKRAKIISPEEYRVRTTSPTLRRYGVNGR